MSRRWPLGGIGAGKAVDSASHRFIIRWVRHEQTVGRFLRILRQLTVASSARHAHACLILQDGLQRQKKALLQLDTAAAFL